VSTEADIIYRYFSAFGAGEAVALGVGDDAAVLRLPPEHELVVSTDTQVAGRHFFPDAFPEDIAYRAVATAASDLAAMAASPLGMTLALTLSEIDDLWLHSFSQGLGKASAALKLPLVGGDLTRGPLTLSVTVMGTVPSGRCIRRDGARAGDLLGVTGTLGDAACALVWLAGELPNHQALSEQDESFLNTRFFQPTPRFEWQDWLLENAHAAMDISDGLLLDARRLAEASGLGVHIDPDRLPLSLTTRQRGLEEATRWALTGGDDYELAIAFPPTVAIPSGITVVGKFTEAHGLHCPGYEAEIIGFDHFAVREPQE